MSPRVAPEPAGLKSCATLCASLFVLACGCVPLVSAQNSAAPVIIVDTPRGTFAFETFPEDAPKTVKHILELVARGFYDGQRFHRALPGFVVQWGDPQSRDLSKEAVWGRGAGAGSGSAIGAAEISRTHSHRRGAVAMSHLGNPALADSQMYVVLDDRPDLNGRYAVFGRVVSGMDVVDKIQRGDVIRKMYVRE